jgi:hypothetical protein
VVVRLFFFIGGGGKATQLVGTGYTLECPVCHNTRPWTLIKTENRVSVFFIPVARWSARFYAVCPVCSTAAPLRSRDEARHVLDTVQHPDPALAAEIVSRAADEGVRF